MANDRTWTLARVALGRSKGQWNVREGRRIGAFDDPGIGYWTDFTPVVEESRLREAETELKDARDDLSALQHQGQAIRDLIAAPQGTQTFTAVLDEFNRMAGAEARAERLEADLKEAREVCEMVDAHYSGSLDWKPPYVDRARGVLAKDAEG